jgi:arylsulfatase
MAARFDGKINIDIRDPESDWTPFAPPKAPQGAPNVVYVAAHRKG